VEGFPCVTTGTYDVVNLVLVGDTNPMTEPEMYAELKGYIDKARKSTPVDPHVSYFERVLESAAKDLQSLTNLYEYVKNRGRF